MPAGILEKELPLEIGFKRGGKGGTLFEDHLVNHFEDGNPFLPHTVYGGSFLSPNFVMTPK